MQVSVLVAAHNEGDRLLRTLDSCASALDRPGWEAVVVDDGSSDGAVDEALRRRPGLRIVRRLERSGPSFAKHLAARAARGRTLLFLDAHCNPLDDALPRLAAAVESQPDALFVPRVASLDVHSWKVDVGRCGVGYGVRLDDFETYWVPKDRLRSLGDRLESPALMGCCVAVRADLYHRLGGFNPDLRFWGVEDVDFGLRAWLCGHPTLIETAAVVGHRFQQSFSYDVPTPALEANQILVAQSLFDEPLRSRWLRRRRQAVGEAAWTAATEALAVVQRPSDRRATAWKSHVVRSVVDYARAFDLAWPAPPEAFDEVAPPPEASLTGGRWSTADLLDQGEPAGRLRFRFTRRKEGRIRIAAAELEPLAGAREAALRWGRLAVYVACRAPAERLPSLSAVDLLDAAAGEQTPDDSPLAEAAADAVRRASSGLAAAPARRSEAVS